MMNDSGSRQRDRKTSLRQSELRTIRRRVHRRFLMANRVKAIPTTQEQLIQVQFNQGALPPRWSGIALGRRKTSERNGTPRKQAGTWTHCLRSGKYYRGTRAKAKSN